jgi:Uma2 family endonuclease
MREGIMRLSMALTERDLIRIQAANRDSRVELRDGKVIVMSPCGPYADAVTTGLLVRLAPFVQDHKLGFVFGSSGGFNLPNGDIIGPDVSFVSRELMRTIPRRFAHVVPNLVVEVKSPSDRIRELEEKLSMVRDLGAQATMLIDPDARTVTLDVIGAQRRVLVDDDLIELPTLLPGWSLRVSQLWPESS